MYNLYFKIIVLKVLVLLMILILSILNNVNKNKKDFNVVNVDVKLNEILMDLNIKIIFINL